MRKPVSTLVVVITLLPLPFSGNAHLMASHTSSFQISSIIIKYLGFRHKIN
jgi:hypothetical protein